MIEQSGVFSSIDSFLPGNVGQILMVVTEFFIALLWKYLVWFLKWFGQIEWQMPTTQSGWHIHKIHVIIHELLETDYELLAINWS